jgi:hypothetical protein
MLDKLKASIVIVAPSKSSTLNSREIMAISRLLPYTANCEKIE